MAAVIKERFGIDQINIPSHGTKWWIVKGFGSSLNFKVTRLVECVEAYSEFERRKLLKSYQQGQREASL